MTKKESEEFAICFTAYLSEVLHAQDSDAAECANMATEMVKSLIKSNSKIKEEILAFGDGAEMLHKLGLLID